MTVAKDLGLDASPEAAVAEMLEAVLAAPAFDEVTATEITSLSDALQDVVATTDHPGTRDLGVWRELGFNVARAEAIVAALASRVGTERARESTANDNAGTRGKRRKKKMRKQAGAASDTPSVAPQEGPETAGRTRPGSTSPAASGQIPPELEAFLEAVDVPLVAADERLVITWINRAAYGLFEHDADEFERVTDTSVDELLGGSLAALMGGETVGARRLRGALTRRCEGAFELGATSVQVAVNPFQLDGLYRGVLATMSTRSTPVATPGDDLDVAAPRMKVQLAASAEELLSVSQRLAGTAEETSSQANLVSAASEEVSGNLQTVAAGMEELSHSISEIARSASSASTVAATGVELAETTNTTVAKLGDSSSEIGKVIKVITTIAQQTNLLALNATIEAARAGEAGKGFAVVANEVKELAKETATASEDISRKVEAIQSGTADAVSAISEINNIVNQINEIQLNIAAAVEQQTATAGEIGRNISEAARGSAEITENVTAVATAARSTSEGASDTKRAAEDLNRLASSWGRE